MSSRTRTSLLSLTIIAVLIFSAIGPTIVYADDGTTSDTTTADTSGGESGSDEEAADTGTGEGESDTSEPAVEGIDETGSDGEATVASRRGSLGRDRRDTERIQPHPDQPQRTICSTGNDQYAHRRFGSRLSLRPLTPRISCRDPASRARPPDR